MICDEDSLFIANLLNQSNVFGQDKCVFETPDEMLLGDLIIFNSDELLDRNESLWYEFWQKIFKPKLTNYLNRGLGTHLLNFVITSACKRGIKRIYGTITQKDVINTPGLTNWYKKYGFQINLPTSEDPSTAVAKILWN